MLSEAFTSDPDRLARFDREAKVLASLNHPNIGSIYGLEEAEGGEFRALVLELIEGPTLADRIAQGPIPIDEALLIATQIAGALEAAHEQGVIHRDLKPANIKVRDDGTVKVLDFGLAKALAATPDGDPSQSPTLTAAATQMGMIMGTAAYMAPEQARGKPVDKRADIWAFGCVFYEMLSGQRAFAGEDVSLTLAAVMTSEPPLTTLPGATPHAVRRIITCCLEKDPTRRLRDIGDLRLLEEGARPDALKRATGSPRRLTWIAAGVVGGALISAGVLWPLRAPPRTLDVDPIRFSIAAPPGVSLGPRQFEMAISPDSTTVVFVGREGGRARLYRRRLDSAEISAISGTEDASSPFFSPDGDQVGFFTPDRILTVAARGDAPPIPVASFTGRHRGATWIADGTIIFADRSPGAPGLWRIPASGGPPEQVANAPAEAVYEWPDVLPDGRTALVAVRPPDDEPHLAVLSLETGDAQTLTPGTFPRYLESGHVAYRRENAIWVVAFDAESGQLTGAPAPAVTNVSSGSFAVSARGALVFAERLSFELAWVDESGTRQSVTDATGLGMDLKLSPDGRRVVVNRDRDIWLHDLVRGTSERVIARTGRDQAPIWGSTGDDVTFTSVTPAGWSLMRVSTSAETGSSPESLVESAVQLFPSSWSPDGRHLVYVVLPGAGNADIWVYEAGGQARPFATTPFLESDPEFSPDGQRLAYTSDRSGEREVYVTSFPEPGRSIPVSTQGGFWPVWSPTGDRLFYRTGTHVVSVDIDEDGDFGLPQPLFEAPVVGGFMRAYDVAPDGSRFLMTLPSADTPAGGRLEVWLNWTETLNRRLSSD